MKDEASRLCLRPDALRPGHDVRLLCDGAESFPRMLEAIRRAERFILLEMYTFADDFVGRRFADALTERARAGVDVRVLYDAGGSRDAARDFFGSMRLQGVRVVAHLPLARALGRFQIFGRDHRKLLIVDGRIAFLGGLNLTREYAPLAEGGQAWRDTQIEMAGPVVADLQGMFEELWSRERRRREPVAATEPSPPRGNVRSLVLTSHRLRNRWEIGRHYRHAILRARERIWIANPYFLPSTRFRRALRRAVQRGVDVRILMPGLSDVGPALSASQRMYARFLRWGVRIFEWPGAMMHAKTAVIDGTWATVGSYNLDHLSLFYNYELTAILVDREFASRMESMFETDLAKSREVTREAWKRRGWFRRLKEELFYSFRALF